MIGTYILFGILASFDAGFGAGNLWLWSTGHRPTNLGAAIASLISLVVVLVMGRWTIRIKRETEAIRRETEALRRRREWWQS